MPNTQIADMTNEFEFIRDKLPRLTRGGYDALSHRESDILNDMYKTERVFLEDIDAAKYLATGGKPQDHCDYAFGHETAEGAITCAAGHLATIRELAAIFI